MSATHFRNLSHGPAHPASAEEQLRSSSGRRRLLWLVSFLAVAWSVTLLVMALQTANPLVVSRDQLLKSDVVVIARRVRAGDDHVSVERVFRGNVAAGDKLRVLNLADIGGFADDQSYVLPLSPNSDGYVVTTLDKQRAAPLVYPVSPDTIEAVKSILRDHL
jgi:hypothetical protein